MHALIRRQFRMKAGCQHGPLPGSDDTSIIEVCQRCHIASQVLEHWRPNKDHAQRFISQSQHLQIDLETFELTAKCIPPGSDVHQTE
jgi:hypothetical protein